MASYRLCTNHIATTYDFRIYGEQITMTDKQIIIDGKIKPITLEDVPTILELHKSKSFVEIAKMYGVTQNAIRYWVKKYNVKPLKQKDQIKILEEQLKRAEKTMQEIWDRLGKTSDELLCKEQECERLKRQHQGDKGLITSTGKMNYQLLQEYDKLKTCLTEIKDFIQKEIDYFEHDIEYQCDWIELMNLINSKISEVEE